MQLQAVKSAARCGKLYWLPVDKENTACMAESVPQGFDLCLLNSDIDIIVSSIKCLKW